MVTCTTFTVAVSAALCVRHINVYVEIIDTDNMVHHAPERMIRHPRHASENNLLQRALKSARVPAIIEPQGHGCSRPDRKRPHGMSLIPCPRE